MLKMFAKVIFVIYFISTICDSSIVDKLNKCGKDDAACQKILMQDLVSLYSTEEVKELGLKTIDPYHIKKLKLILPGYIEILFRNGFARNLKHCVVNKFEFKFDRLISYLDLTCKSITLDGEYKAVSIGPAIGAVLGGNQLDGNGNAELQFDNVHMKIAFYFKLEHRDGEIYMKYAKKKSELKSFKVEKLHVKQLTNVKLDNVDVSKEVKDFMNSNWDLFMTSFGKIFGQTVLDIITDYVGKSMDVLPLKYLISDDMSSYVEN